MLLVYSSVHGKGEATQAEDGKGPVRPATHMPRRCADCRDFPRWRFPGTGQPAAVLSLVVANKRWRPQAAASATTRSWRPGARAQCIRFCSPRANATDRPGRGWPIPYLAPARFGYTSATRVLAPALPPRARCRRVPLAASPPGFFSQPVTPNRSTPVPVNQTGLTGYR